MHKALLKRKWLCHVVTAMCVTTAACSLGSCSKDLDTWEPVMLDAQCQQKDDVPYNGGTFTIDVNSNTNWKVESPEWMTVDKNDGRGQGKVSITVAKNENINARTGSVKIVAGGAKPDGNIAGSIISTVTIRQTALADAVNPASVVKINAVTANISRHYTGSNIFYRRFRCSGSISYNVKSDYSNDFIAAVFKGFSSEITFLTSDDKTFTTRAQTQYSPLRLYVGAQIVSVSEELSTSGDAPMKYQIKIYGYDKKNNKVLLYSDKNTYQLRLE